MKQRLKMLKIMMSVGLLIGCGLAQAQIAPSDRVAVDYTGLLAAASRGDAIWTGELLQQGLDVDVRDDYQRTPLHVAAYGGHHGVMQVLVRAGADPNALEHDDYDIVTIASVADDVATLKISLELGAHPGNITSPYEGTALIAAAHLGHVEVVRILIDAGAPLDHVNNLGWTAVIEAIVLGDGGPRHQAVLKALVDAGADINIPDRNGTTPLQLARRMGYTEMVKMLKMAGAR